MVIDWKSSPQSGEVEMDDVLAIAGKTYRSRLLVGTGEYRGLSQERAAIGAPGAQNVTGGVRRTNIGQTKGEPAALDFLPPSQVTFPPNTAGCYTASDAVRTLR